jgi:tetratricopeptide (TPR) repeat protein
MVIRERQRSRPLTLALFPQEDWTNVNPAQREGIAVLLKDCLEVAGGLPVVEEESVVPERSRTMDVLRVGFRRQGDLALARLEFLRGGRLRKTWASGPQAPAAAVAGLLSALGMDPLTAEALLPASPEGFWTLAGLAQRPRDQEIQKAVAEGERLAEREPRCASAWTALGRLTHHLLLTRPSSEADAQIRCDGEFRRALELVPHYPGAVVAYARFLTDIGNQRGALDLLFTALRAYPRAPRLYEGVAYAARTSGLLEGALRALKKRDQLLGLSRGEPRLTENTYLYAGNLETFGLLLGEGEGSKPDTIRNFYRGYLKLLQGDAQEAGVFMERAYLRTDGNPQFEVLARAYHLGIQGRGEEGTRLLREAWAARIPMRVPDGEYTFKLAEAFVFLDCPREAQEVATRAFAQGFGCTTWFERSPFLEGIRGTARWNALRQHLHERQALLERSFPLDRFRF